MRSLNVEAYAKINRGLRVLGRRPDGYHEIETVFQSVNLVDRLRLDAREVPTVSLEVVPDLGIPPHENLAVRAALLVRERIGFQGGVHIRLSKGIPAGAGLGGGSSDAAATLVGLSELFGLGLDREGLKALAARLGRDVPFFIEGGCRRATGKGERLSVCPDGRPTEFVVLLVPPFSLDTGEVYRTFDRIGPSPSLRRPTPLTNDLEAAALELRPELEAFRAFLERSSAPFGLSGSGPTYYALLDRAEEARRFARRARDALACRVFLCRPTPVGWRLVPSPD